MDSYYDYDNRVIDHTKYADGTDKPVHHNSSGHLIHRDGLHRSNGVGGRLTGGDGLERSPGVGGRIIEGRIT